MRICLARKRLTVGLIGVACWRHCSTESPPQQSTAPASHLPAAPASPRLVATSRRCPTTSPSRRWTNPGRRWCPTGWTLSVWARVPKARMAAWTPGRRAAGFGARQWSDRETRRRNTVRRRNSRYCSKASTSRTGWRSRARRSTSPRAIRSTPTTTPTAQPPTGEPSPPGYPTREAPNSHGAYAHALKSVAVGTRRRGLLLDRLDGQHLRRGPQANPPRGVDHADPAGRRAGRAVRTGVRNGTGLAVAPDGSLWTAVNNRDNAPDPERQRQRQSSDYVNEHPPESLAKLTPGRELGWPYCNPDGGPANLPFVRDMSDEPRRRSWTARRCRRSSRASALTRRRSG